MYDYTIELKNGESYTLRVHESLTPDQVYEHMVRHSAYNLITGKTGTPNVDRSVEESFLLDLRKRV